MRFAVAWRWPAAAALLFLAGSLVLVRDDIATRRAAFQVEARAAHRLLSQRAAQHDAILATLVLLDTGVPGTGSPAQRLIAVYPQVLAVARRDRDAAWPVTGLLEAEARARASHDNALGPVELTEGRFWLVRAGEPASFALQVAIERMLPRDAWPFAAGGPVRATLAHAGAERVLQPGAPPSDRPAGLTAGFVFAAPLSVASQPFELRLARATGPAEWPWTLLFAWALASAIGVAALAAWRQAREARRRADRLVRLHRVERLNALGEFAGGVAHELNQPLTAVLASTQAAQRLLADDEPDLATAREAMTLAAAQARRAADVLARLRQAIAAPAAPGARGALSLAEAANGVLALFAPAIAADGVIVRLEGTAPAVHADAVALEQILHNLVDNALQAMRARPRDRNLVLTLGTEGTAAICRVADSGPGIVPEAMEHLFEPLNTTREGGMGLGLALARSLAESMGGSLTAGNRAAGGAEFRLALPLAGH